MAMWLLDLEAEVTGLPHRHPLSGHVVEALDGRFGDHWVVSSDEVARMRDGRVPAISPLPDAERWAEELVEVALSYPGDTGRAADAARAVAREEGALEAPLLVTTDATVSWDERLDTTAPDRQAGRAPAVLPADVRPPFHPTHEWRYATDLLDGETYDAVDQVMVVDGLGYSRWQWVDGGLPEWRVDERGGWSSRVGDAPLALDAEPDPLPTRYTMDSGGYGLLHLVEIDRCGVRDLGPVDPETLAELLHGRVLEHLGPLEAARIDLGAIAASCWGAVDEWPLWEVTLGEVAPVGRRDIPCFGEGGVWYREYPPLAIEQPAFEEVDPLVQMEPLGPDLAPAGGGGGEGGM